MAETIQAFGLFVVIPMCVTLLIDNVVRVVLVALAARRATTKESASND